MNKIFETFLDEVLVNDEWVEHEVIVHYDLFEGQRGTRHDPEYSMEIIIESVELIDGTDIELTEAEKDRIENEIMNSLCSD